MVSSLSETVIAIGACFLPNNISQINN